MNETQLQAKIVLWFSQSYPQHRGLLFEVNNDSISEKEIFIRIAKRNKGYSSILLGLLDKLTFKVKNALLSIRKAMGMIAGVSDLVLISPSTAIVSGIELKAPNSTHKVDHLNQQIEWGKKIVDAGGGFIMSCDENKIKQFIVDLITYNLTDCVLPEIDQSKKTYKFK